MDKLIRAEFIFWTSQRLQSMNAQEITSWEEDAITGDCWTRWVHGQDGQWKAFRTYFDGEKVDEMIVC